MASLETSSEANCKLNFNRWMIRSCRRHQLLWHFYGHPNLAFVRSCSFSHRM